MFGSSVSAVSRCVLLEAEIAILAAPPRTSLVHVHHVTSPSPNVRAASPLNLSLNLISRLSVTEASPCTSSRPRYSAPHRIAGSNLASQCTAISNRIWVNKVKGRGRARGEVKFCVVTYKLSMYVCNYVCTRLNLVSHHMNYCWPTTSRNVIKC